MATKRSIKHQTSDLYCPLLPLHYPPYPNRTPPLVILDPPPPTLKDTPLIDFQLGHPPVYHIASPPKLIDGSLFPFVPKSPPPPPPCLCS